MKFEDRNKKPQEASKNLPMAVLITLIAVVCLLLYVGWQMISDEASTVSDLSPQTIVIEDSYIPGPEVVSSEDTPKPAAAKVDSDIALDAKTTVHTVSKGETFFSIASRYNLTVTTLKAYNTNLSPESLSVGSKMNVPVLAIHTVGSGDILRVVGGKYGVTVKAIMTANGKTKNHSERGEKLIIPFKEKK